MKTDSTFHTGTKRFFFWV